MNVRTREEFVVEYVSLAPLPLALERSVECTLYVGREIARPVLDMGCGEGLFAHVLFAEPLDTGIDPMRKELERAKALGSYEELIEAFGDKIPKADGSYRTVISNSVLEHIPDLQPVLREIFRVLEPGGRFYATVPSDRFASFSAGSIALSGAGLKGAAAAFRKRYDRFWAHHHAYSLQRWRATMEDAGFAVDEAFTYGSRRFCVTNDLLVPLSGPSLVLKKLTNRWTVAPALRRRLAGIASGALERVVRDAARPGGGGLVFLALRKPR